MKVPAHLVLGGVRFLDCTQITFCSILTWQNTLVSPPVLIRAPIPPWEPHPHDLMTSSNHNHLPKALPPKPSLEAGVWGVVRASTDEFEGNTNILSIRNNE